MDDKNVVKALAALAQPNRLQVFRSLVVAGQQGSTPGELGEYLGMPNATVFCNWNYFMYFINI